ncbi:tetratricopeptide repeat protein [Sphingomonas colocasiae]|uniref:Tetratricopeptide repeat protein n=2 Tax=Sphingomonas colocasiae TaxID=1848973 RepID=A0ABS7PKA8_9SPHN|nr:tetratricopeptide repeat protein [Sphingomonas colocasiae]
MGRWALGAAGVITLAAIGVAVIRKDDAPPPAPAQQAQSTETPDQAIAKLEARLKANPQDVQGWQLLGWAFFETGRFPEAATAYRRATALAPDKADLWSALGEALALSTEKRELPKDAADAFARAIALDPKDARARYFLAVGKDVAGDHKGALDAWFALLADTPAGAPWEADLRRTIEEVAAREKIDVAARLAAVKPAPAAPSPSVATAAIPGPTREQMQAAAALPKGQQEMMIQSMVDGLEAKLKADPANPNGWIMLMRSRMTLGETARASAAWKSAIAANPGAKAQIDEAARALGIPGG